MDGSPARRLVRQVGVFLELIKFPHTVFALPFAFMGAVLAAGGIPAADKAAWILVAMVGARSGAMAMNRLADRELDARNPRTADRAFPRGLVRTSQVAVLVGVSYALFLYAAWRLNPLCFTLAPVAILITAGYSYTKRFTTLSHLILGLSLAMAPVGAWIAVTGRLKAAPVVLGVAVLFWVAGFDILYALQDVDFDRRSGLYSLPARMGADGAVWVARGFHLLTVASLVGLIPLLHLGDLYLAGATLVAGLLAYEHLILARYGLSRLDVAFFNVNGIVSVILFAFTLGDLLLR